MLFTPNLKTKFPEVKAGQISVQLLNCVWLFANLMDCSTPGLPIPHYLPEFAQVHVYGVGDAIQPSNQVSSQIKSSQIRSWR